MENTKSLFININNLNKKQLDENGLPLNGLKIYAKDYNNGKKTILRFIDGFLDGDQFDEFGNLLRQKPAVETDGHVEYWRKNKLHRDNGEPAVLSDNFKTKEYWEDGIQIKKI